MQKSTQESNVCNYARLTSWAFSSICTRQIDNKNIDNKGDYCMAINLTKEEAMKKIDLVRKS
jgi:hypothetical protein